MVGWPAVTWEERPWVPAEGPGSASRTARRRHRGPYQAAVPPLVAELEVPLPAATLAASTDAGHEIARFDAELGGEIAPFSTVLLRTESAASSQIEQLTASARALGEAELGEVTGANAVHVLGNVTAMKAALSLAEDLTEQNVLDMHAALLATTDPDIAGRWREVQVWIGGSGLGPHAATFVPPHPAHVGALVADLLAFVRRDDLPVLTHLALAHAQFETIHPFVDGNGRTGRALMHAMLRAGGLVRNVTVPLSAGLLADVDGYFDALTAYREGRPEVIVEQVTEATYAALDNGRELVRDLRAVRAGWDQRIPVRRGAASWRAADVLVRHPVVNAALLSRELGISPQNVYRTMEPLLAAGVVRSSGRQRNRVWRAPEVLDAVDAFARRAGRRRRGR